MSYSGPEICSMLALIPQSGDFSGATLGVRSVALLQVPKWSASLRLTRGKVQSYKEQQKSRNSALLCYIHLTSDF